MINKYRSYEPDECYGNVGPYDIVAETSNGDNEPFTIVDSRTNEEVDTVDGLNNALIQAGQQCNFDNQLGLH
jgi:hypothetical protein